MAADIINRVQAKHVIQSLAAAFGLEGRRIRSIRVEADIRTGEVHVVTDEYPVAFDPEKGAEVLAAYRLNQPSEVG